MNDNTANNSIKRLDTIREEGNKLLVSYGDRYLHEVEVKGYIGNNGASHDAYHYWLVKDGSGCIDLVVETNASNEVIGHEDNAQINAESIALLGWTGEAREFNVDLKDGIDRVKDTVRYLKDEVSYIEDEAKASGCEAYDCKALAHLAKYLEARAAEAEAYLSHPMKVIDLSKESEDEEEPEGIAKFPPDLVSDMECKLEKATDLWVEIEGTLLNGPIAWLADTFNHEAPIADDELEDAMSDLCITEVLDYGANATQWRSEGSEELPFDSASEWFLFDPEEGTFKGLYDSDLGDFLHEATICQVRDYLEWLAVVSESEFSELARLLDL